MLVKAFLPFITSLRQFSHLCFYQHENSYHSARGHIFRCFIVASFITSQHLSVGCVGECGNKTTSQVCHHAISDYKIVPATPFPQEVKQECTLMVAIMFPLPMGANWKKQTNTKYALSPHSSIPCCILITKHTIFEPENKNKWLFVPH